MDKNDLQRDVAAELPRFATDADARRMAQKLSAKHRDTRYVIESRDDGKPPFVVDDNGFTRNWERTIAVYTCGVIDND